MSSYIQPFVSDEEMNGMPVLMDRTENQNGLMTMESMTRYGLSEHQGPHMELHARQESYLPPHFSSFSTTIAPYTSHVLGQDLNTTGISTRLNNQYQLNHQSAYPQSSNQQHFGYNLPFHPSVTSLRQTPLRHSPGFPLRHPQPRRTFQYSLSGLNQSCQPSSVREQIPFAPLNQAIDTLQSQLYALQLSPLLNTNFRINTSPSETNQILTLYQHTSHEHEEIQTQLSHLQNRLQEAEERIDDLSHRHDFAFEALFGRILDIEEAVFGRGSV